MSENTALNHTQAAKYLGVAAQTLYNWRHKRRGPDYVRMGRKIVYRQWDLDRFMESRKIVLGA